MSEATSTFKHINSGNASSLSFDVSNSCSPTSSPRSLSPCNCWPVKYQTLSNKTQATGAWDGYNTKEEFIAMHIR